MERWRKMRRRTWNNQGLCITHCNVNDTAVIINSILYIVPNMNSNYSHNYFNNSGISFGVFFPKKQRVEQSFNTKKKFFKYSHKWWGLLIVTQVSVFFFKFSYFNSVDHKYFFFRSLQFWNPELDGSAGGIQPAGRHLIITDTCLPYKM